jgi:hypothetical protein
MQNKEELRQNGHDGSQKMTCRWRGKRILFLDGEINIVCRSKYRPDDAVSAVSQIALIRLQHRRIQHQNVRDKRHQLCLRHL